MRPVNNELRQAKLNVALAQLATIEQRYSKALGKINALEQQWKAKVSQIEALGGQVASGIDEIVPTVDTSNSTDTTEA